MPDETSRGQHPEQAPHDSEAWYRLLFKHMQDGVVYCRTLFHPDGRPRDLLVLDANGAFEALTGLADPIGMTATELLPGVWKSQPEVLRQYARIARSGRAERFEAFFAPLARWYSASLFSPHPDHVVTVLEDVTRRKQAEQALERDRTLLESITRATDVMLAYLDRDFDFVWVNAAYAASAHRPAAELVGMNHFALYPHAENETIFGRVRDSGEPVFYKDKPFEYPDQPERGVTYWDWSLVPVKGEDGRVAGLVFSLRETTRYRRAELALRDADRRKDEFLGMLSHELRNPLAPILNAVYLLEHGDPTSERAARARGIIRRQAEHLTRLVDDLLDVTRIARGKVELRRERLDLCEVVRRTAEDFRSLVERDGVTFRVEVPDGELCADADATRLAQVIGNLLQNAAKFTGVGDVVTLSLRAAGGRAVLSVRDTGEGIDPALLPSVFEPFVQADRTLARTEGGLGLGLALVKGIAELHGGAVRAESAGRGKGAELVVELPLCAPAPAG